jgi:hypothetical protein
MRRLGTIGFFVMLFAAASPLARAADLTPPAARASVLDITLPAPAGGLIAVAQSAARGGDAPLSSASAVTVAGNAPESVVATPQAPDAVKSVKDYVDPTSSLTLQTGFAEAHVAGAGATARAGFGAGSGSGFALANKFFTFDQQAQMLAEWQSVNDQIAGAINTALSPLAGALATAGISVPQVTGIPATGLVNVMTARNVASSSSASISPGYASARADATVAQLNLFDGFLQIDDVTAQAVSESVSGADTRTASVKYGRLFIAGIEVVLDGDHLAVAGNSVLDRAVVQPVLDTVLGALSTLGIRIHAGDAVADGVTRSVSALSVDVASPGGPVHLAIGYASASAPTVPAVLGERFHNPGTPATAPPPGPVTIVHPPVSSGAIVAAPSTTTTTIGPIDRHLGPRAARALALAFLIVVGGSLLVTAGPLPFVRRRRARHQGALP